MTAEFPCACVICGKAPPADDVALWRTNKKGKPGIWACSEHRSTAREAVRRMDPVAYAEYATKSELQDWQKAILRERIVLT